MDLALVQLKFCHSVLQVCTHSVSMSSLGMARLTCFQCKYSVLICAELWGCVGPVLTVLDLFQLCCNKSVVHLGG